MKGFIELTAYGSGDKILCPVRIITGVCEDNGGTFVETGLDGKGKETGIFVKKFLDRIKDQTKNFVEEVKEKILKCEV